jgi:hypothetical protein
VSAYEIGWGTGPLAIAAAAAGRMAAAAQYEMSGSGDRAARLRHEAEVIESAVDLR